MRRVPSLIGATVIAVAMSASAFGGETQRVTPDRMLDFGQDLWVELPDVAAGDLGPPRLARRPGDESGPFGVLLESGASHTYSLSHHANGGVLSAFDSVRWSGIVAVDDSGVLWLELLDNTDSPALIVTVDAANGLSVEVAGTSFLASSLSGWTEPRRLDLMATPKSLRLWVDQQEVSFDTKPTGLMSQIASWRLKADNAEEVEAQTWAWLRAASVAVGEGELLALMGIDDARPAGLLARDVEDTDGDGRSVGWTVQRSSTWLGWDTAHARILWSQSELWPGNVSATATDFKALDPARGGAAEFRVSVDADAPLLARVEMVEDPLDPETARYVSDVYRSRTLGNPDAAALPSKPIDTYTVYCWYQSGIGRPYGFAQAILSVIDDSTAESVLSMEEDAGLYRDNRRVPPSLEPVETVLAPDRNTPVPSGSGLPLLEVEWESRRDPWLTELLTRLPTATGAFSDHDVHNNVQPRWERQDFAAPAPFGHLLRSEVWARMVSYINTFRSARAARPGPAVMGRRLLMEAGHHVFDHGPVRRIYLDLGRFKNSESILGSEQFAWARGLVQSWDGRILELHVPFPVHGAVQKRQQDVPENGNWEQEMNLLLSDAQDNSAIEQVVLVAADAHIPILHVQPNPLFSKVRAEFYAGSAAAPWLGPALLPEERDTIAEIRQYVQASDPASWVEDLGDPNAIGSGRFLRTFGRVRYETNGEIIFTLVDADFDFVGDRTWEDRVLRETTLPRFPKQEEISPADLDGDGVVGPADLAILFASWGQTGPTPADISEDGVVDAADLAALLAEWTP